MTSYSLFSKIESLPPDLRKEASNFIEFLLNKTKRKQKEKPSKSGYGSLKGKIHMSEDFDAPLDDFKEIWN